MKKSLIIFLSIVCAIIALFVVFAIIPPGKVMEDNPFIKKTDYPLLAAHRGGAGVNPENTFKAFESAINDYKADILELDTCLSKDEHLVIIHNLTLNSSTDIVDLTGVEKDYYVNDYDLSELQKLNFGYNFQKDGAFPYRSFLENVLDENKSSCLEENDLRIVTIEELFKKYESTDLLFVIEIKNSGDLGLKATDNLASLIYKYHMEKRVSIGTFHDEVEEKLSNEYPDLIRGASVSAAAKFVITQMLGVNIFDTTSFACLQIPTAYNIKGINISLDKTSIINRAHRRGISVQYWTINDKEEMRDLIEKGADVIMTDRPDIYSELIEELKNGNSNSSGE